MGKKRKILLKLTGELLFSSITKQLSSAALSVIMQLKQLQTTHYFGIVIGGGNFFRGATHGAQLGLNPANAHQIGMLATTINGLILKDLLEQQEIKAALLCAIPMPGIGLSTSQQEIMHAIENDTTLIFAGGTGNPFFTTDTNAILRSLQINAQEVWKGTNVDGIYTVDPHKNADAQLLKQVTYTQALEKKLAIMDATAFAMAEQFQKKIRVFNIFKDQALIHAADDNNFGSIIL